MIKAFWHKTKNVGDTLTPILLEYFTGEKVEFTERNEQGKLVGVGSIISGVRDNDIVWGAGCISETENIRQYQNVKYLAVRGKLTEKKLGITCGVYGDPALLLPLLYNPKIEKKYKVGFIPHYADKNHPFVNKIKNDEGVKIIDIKQDYKTFIDEVLSCKDIVSSSLHGIIIAEAYGIPAMWLKLSDLVLGNGFKFMDYLSGTGRIANNPPVGGMIVLQPIKNLKEIQDKLINSLKNYVATRN